MCGRYTLTKPEKITSRFKISNKLPLLDPNYNVAPSFTMPIVTKNSPNKVVMAKWGFLPEYEFRKPKPFGLINIRAETFKEKPYFQRYLIHNRCIVPTTGFFEWKELNLEGRPEKFPWYIGLKDQDLFGFAGVYSMYKDAEGKEQYYYAILTTEPNSFMKNIHRRMPVILKEKEEELFLDPDNQDFEKLYKLITSPFPSEKMKGYPVSKQVNSPRNNNKELLYEAKTSETDQKLI